MAVAGADSNDTEDTASLDEKDVAMATVDKIGEGTEDTGVAVNEET